MIRHLLVTGAAGFFGRHFCQHVGTHAPGVEMVATDIRPAGADQPGRFVPLDLLDEAAAADLVRAVRPDCVVHLAGTFGAATPAELYRANVLPLVNLLEISRQEAPEAILLTAGSAAEYGPVAADRLPVAEDCPCLPITLYGHTKLVATQLAQFYHRVHGLRTMIVRPFQLIGRGVTEQLAPGAFAARIKQARATGQPAIRVGNLDSQRDFLDVEDAAEGVWALCQQPAPGEVFNLCSGQPTRMRDLLAHMIKASGAAIRVETDPALLRGPADVPAMYGSFAKLNRQCGWQPRRSPEESVRSLLTQAGRLV